MSATKDRNGAPEIMNNVVAGLARRGVSLLGAQELSVTGRRSGEIRSTPVNPLLRDGELYLVSARGNTQWVRNVRTTPEVHLRVGRRSTAYTAVELPNDVKVPLLRAYLKRWGWQVKPMFAGITASSTDDQVATVAGEHPVFRLELVG
ncbi:nitroreductase family deazaflavin-dependent oxidoreductase [Leekyejoonella antrihumi]|uniref:Nitroreductase family deazaflavin-dependent oxidoreductase n=1 Tax=Leekyejoonella antrihumi TaxID=1660198 RepID=A0A563DVT6_9MICO|nr:nitroreductase family deazaflavin-dependent oxidoreductase [Leekyejoonella antrihumi]TWP34316.1 nitroreductase family deazaflavin-dependent oxidoreductase [Leekyejoonella antrihumi]